MRVAARLLTVVAVFGVVGVSAAIGNAVGMPISQIAPLGLLVAGVMVVSIMRVFAGGASDSPVAIAAAVRRLRLLRAAPAAPVTTAGLVRLPHALPLCTSAEVFRDPPTSRPDELPDLPLDLQAHQGRDDSVTATNPDYARAVMTDDVVGFTRHRLASWWVDGAVLASTARVGHGAPPDLLVHNIEAITWLATALSAPPIVRYGSPAVQPDIHA